MPKQIVIAEQHRIAAVFSEDQIQEIIVATGSHQVGDIYLGTVENILPGINAAFVNIGDSDKNGFMHADDLGPLRLKRMAGSITELLAPRQKVLVQIMKEPTGNKGPRLTGKVTLPGRYLVLMPYSKGVNLSRRIRNEAERNRLRALGILIKPPGMGLLIRTEAESVSEDAIIEDLEALQKRWESIQQEAMNTRPPSLLNRDDDFIQRVLRDVYSDDVNRIVTDTSSGYERTKQHLSSWSDGRIPTGILIDHHRESTHILEYFRVNAAIREALKPRVDLPSGGYIIIEPTEALTVIDVNSGSFTRSSTARETVLWTNCEAAIEIARQLKLRNIAGVIVVDFIDMESRRDQMQVLEQFGMSLRSDKSRPQISQLSELGLVELTRKRQGQNIYELFGQTCPTCGGLGHLARLPSEAPGHIEALSGGTIRPQGYSSPVQSFSSRPLAKEDRAASFDAPSELQELDLLNHPNYQDKNGRGNRRRRRRGTEKQPSRGVKTGPASPVPNLKDVEDLGHGQRRNRHERIDRGDVNRSVGDNRLDLTDTEEKLVLQPDEKDTANTEPTTRNKRTRSGRRKPEEPPEMIAVEMPPEEQRIYAVMGLSPLVYSGKTAENTQNTIVSVVLPGEAETFMASLKAQAEAEVSNKRIIQTPVQTEAKRAGLKGELEDSEGNEDDDDVDNDVDNLSQTADLEEVDSVHTSANGISSEQPNDNASGRAAPIRRRRRSSNRRAAETKETLPAFSTSAVDPIGSSMPSLDSMTDEKPTVGSAPKPLMNQSGRGASRTSSKSTSETEASAESVSDTEAEEPVVRRRRRRSSANE